MCQTFLCRKFMIMEFMWTFAFCAQNGDNTIYKIGMPINYCNLKILLIMFQFLFSACSHCVCLCFGFYCCTLKSFGLFPKVRFKSSLCALKVQKRTKCILWKSFFWQKEFWHFTFYHFHFLWFCGICWEHFLNSGISGLPYFFQFSPFISFLFHFLP